MRSTHGRTLIVSDIHGNLAALEAVLREPHDGLICLGDVVGYGPEPGGCLRRLVAEDAVLIQGNHDRSLADGSPPRCRPSFERLALAAAPLGEAQLTRDEKRHLGSLPRWLAMDLGPFECMAVHATPSDPLYRYLGPDENAWAVELEASDDDIVLVGHTHLQFDLRTRAGRVVNPGSVSQPKDGNPDAAFALVDGESVRFGRVPYDVAVTIEALRSRGVEGQTLRDLGEILTRGRVPERLSGP